MASMAKTGRRQFSNRVFSLLHFKRIMLPDSKVGSAQVLNEFHKV